MTTRRSRGESYDREASARRNSLGRDECCKGGCCGRAPADSEDDAGCCDICCCIPWAVIVNFSTATACAIMAISIEPDLEKAAKQFGYATDSWRSILTWGLVGLLAVDGCIMFFSIAATQYCINHGCGRCLVENKVDRVGRRMNKCEGCDNCVAVCCGDAVQWALFVLSWILSLVFTIGLWAISMTTVLVMMAFGACKPYFDNGDAESTTETLKLVANMVTILQKSMEMMPGAFYNEQDLQNFNVEVTEHCDAIKPGAEAAKTIWIIIMVLCICQWHLTLTGRSNISRVDGSEKGKQQGHKEAADVLDMQDDMVRRTIRSQHLGAGTLRGVHQQQVHPVQVTLHDLGNNL